MYISPAAAAAPAPDSDEATRLHLSLLSVWWVKNHILLGHAHCLSIFRRSSVESYIITRNIRRRWFARHTIPQYLSLSLFITPVETSRGRHSRGCRSHAGHLSTRRTCEWCFDAAASYARPRRSESVEWWVSIQWPEGVGGGGRGAGQPCQGHPAVNDTRPPTWPGRRGRARQTPASVGVDVCRRYNDRAIRAHAMCGLVSGRQQSLTLSCSVLLFV